MCAVSLAEHSRQSMWWIENAVEEIVPVLFYYIEGEEKSQRVTISKDLCVKYAQYILALFFKHLARDYFGKKIILSYK